MADIIQFRRDTSANWTSVNPILAQGEFGFETDTDKAKIGDGTTSWTGLAYVFNSTDIAGEIVGATAKTTPVDADLVGIVDSADSNTLKKLSWANIKATLKTYFDTLYESAFTKGSLIAGTNVTLTGTISNRLVGAGDVTINALGGGGGSAEYYSIFTGYYTHSANSLTGTSWAQGDRFYVPMSNMMFTSADATISKVSFRLSGAGSGGSLVRIGIYERTTLNNLTLVGDFGTLSSDALNSIELTFTAVTLTKGKLYYLVYQRDDVAGATAPTFQAWSGAFVNQDYMVGPASGDMWQTNQALRKTSVTAGALAGTDTLPTVSTNVGTPRIQWYLNQ
jgi:hypothetical protein